MIDSGAFVRFGNRYTSYSRDVFSLSPAYVTAAAAKRVIEEQGFSGLKLPQGYSLEILRSITYLMGQYETRVRISASQAWQLKEIAQELLSSCKSLLKENELEAAEWLVRYVK